MNLSMIQASVTMGQLQQKLDLIGNNLANTNTTGYKSRNSNFSSLLVQQIDNLDDESAERNRITPDGIRIGTGAQLGHTNLNLSQGSLQNTGRELDVALLGDNQLFQVQVPTEEGTETQYTRAGNFYLNPLDNGQLLLTNADGYPVIGEDGDPIAIEEGFDGISITENGGLSITRGEQQEIEAQLDVVEAVRPRILEAAGQNRFRIPDNIPDDGIFADVAFDDQQMQSQTLEASNVEIQKELTDLLMAQRAYQFNAKSISTSDQMMGLVNQLRS
ncbi:flagellar hook-basal body protein [Halobacillus litoralis]|uniref:flagellar hook-basal body protein n=1 Tax=Halobacillus litoralis TaxID=45668 RepID=UPI001CD3BF79|nr:flagellar hook-basal body protein [Halobacillus litoralis]MCA0971008.1 flagellar hook-basal body protein [Halobacillus litoralis]